MLSICHNCLFLKEQGIELSMRDESQWCTIKTWEKDRTLQKEGRQRQQMNGEDKETWQGQAVNRQKVGVKIKGQIKSPVISSPQAPRCITWYMSIDLYLSDTMVYVPSFYVRRGQRAVSLVAGSHYQLAHKNECPLFSPLCLLCWKCWYSPAWRTGFLTGSPRTSPADSSPRRESR